MTSGNDHLAEPCSRCGEPRGHHTTTPNPFSGSTCPGDQEWYCWECCNLGGYYQGEGFNDVWVECLCCEDHDHAWDAESPPPCAVPSHEEVPA